MKRLRIVSIGTVMAAMLAATGAHADYESRPDLLPINRCPSSVLPKDCQPLYWDLPAATFEGQQELGAPDPTTGYRHGITDRPPPLYTDGTNGFEQQDAGRTRTALCPLAGDPATADPDRVPHWKPTGIFAPSCQVPGEGSCQYYVVECHRGTRIHYGPWQVGPDYERSWDAVVRVENSSRLDQDMVTHPENGRREWFTAIEIFNHVGSHHANMWDPVNKCNDPDNPAYASSQECQDNYQKPYYDQSGCRSDVEGPQPGCPAYVALSNPSQWRAATQYPGRFDVTFPTAQKPGEKSKALPLLEDQLWPMEHHVVSVYFNEGLHENQDFRNQVGGAVGEIVLQVLTEPFSDPNLERISVLFETVYEAATLFVPPFTIATNGGVWYAPYDLELALLTTHSHKRTVRSWVDVVPANPYRPDDPDPRCGGSPTGTPAAHVFENYHWDDANTCKYYLAPDGNVILHKGEGLSFGCLFNNGVTATSKISDPNLRDAVERGLVGKQVLYGEQDPGIYRVHYGCEERPDWQSIDPSDTTTPSIPPGRAPATPARRCDPNPALDANGEPVDGPYENLATCGPRGALGPSLSYDGQGSGLTGRCVPANIVFANADDEMCIMVGMYWPLPRVADVNADVNGSQLVDEGALASGDVEGGIKPRSPDDVAAAVSTGDPAVTVNPSNLDTTNPEQTGLPGALPKSPSDLGKCEGCSQALPPLSVN